ISVTGRSPCISAKLDHSLGDERWPRTPEMIVRRKFIRGVTTKLLRDSKIERPPVPVEQIARARGAVIRRGRVEPKVSGFLYRNTARGHAVIGVNSAQHPNRQRFTVAH